MHISSILCKVCGNEFTSKKHTYKHYMCPYCGHVHIRTHEPSLGDLIEQSQKQKRKKGAMK